MGLLRLVYMGMLFSIARGVVVDQPEGSGVDPVLPDPPGAAGTSGMPSGSPKGKSKSKGVVGQARVIAKVFKQVYVSPWADKGRKVVDLTIKPPTAHREDRSQQPQHDGGRTVGRYNSFSRSSPFDQLQKYRLKRQSEQEQKKLDKQQREREKEYEREREKERKRQYDQQLRSN
ncbi:hypothetical protein BSLG_006231 [Batrachochytrium salamandrivorans]|nr:hypothetical protein BSLG_006231 [Batrachochytrium salamandrivorans]